MERTGRRTSRPKAYVPRSEAERQLDLHGLQEAKKLARLGALKAIAAAKQAADASTARPASEPPKE